MRRGLAVAVAVGLGLGPGRVAGAVSEPTVEISEPEASESAASESAVEASEPAVSEPAAGASEPAVEVDEPPPSAAEDPPVSSEDPPAPAATQTHDVPADDFEREGLAPGGYYGHGVILERPPPDGKKQIVLGSILVPLGILAAVSSGVGVWMTVPQHCVARLGSVGSSIEDPAQCQGLFIYNVINASYGALMLVSGATILGIGLVKRDRYRKWRARHGMQAWLRPARGGAFGGLQLRF